MIDIKMVGSLGVVSNLEETMETVAELMYQSVRQNFVEGGRPARWLPLKQNPFGRTDAFHPPDKFVNNLEKSFTGGTATVYMGGNLPYARIQNFGGVNYVRATPEARKFFWRMWYNTNDEMWKNMALTEKAGFFIRIPARTFMMFQEEDIQKILELIGSGIIKFSTTGLIEESATITR
jgi:phage gpG-like protein